MHDVQTSDEVTILKGRPRLTLDEIARLAEAPLREAGAERAIVFGSWARGDADGFSDLDLVVVAKCELPPLERGLRFGRLVDVIPLGVDLLVYTPEEFARGMRDRYGIFDAITREGVTIYPRSDR